MRPEPSPVRGEGLVIGSYTPYQRAAVTWELLFEMFCMRYVPMMKRERLDQEYLDLR